MSEENLNKKTRVRFAPSPTGSIHIGNLRTALFAWLLARKNEGSFLVRVEDTDRKRSNEDATKKIFEALAWVGLDVDEGVYLNEQSEIAQKGELGPYIQSERLEIYQKYIQELLKTGKAYYCFCSEERLQTVREQQQKDKQPIMYDKHCCDLSPEDAQTKIQNGEEYVIRMKVPKGEIIEFRDEVFGKISVKSEIVDDQVLIKTDGFPTYHFAVVVDDHLMEISHIFRGEDWIPSTPKHILLYKFFGWETPIFIHLPNVLGEDKKKLSKRAGAVSVEEFKEKGYCPEALINFLALLGWNPKTEQEIFNREELIEKFSIAGLHKSGAFFNYQKLNWFNKEYIKLLGKTEFENKVMEFLPEELKEIALKNGSIFVKILPIIKERIEKFEDILTMEQAGEFDFYFEQPDYLVDNLNWKKESDLNNTKKYLEKTQKLLEELDEFSTEKIKNKIWNYAEEQGIGFVLWPLRFALSGRDKSPDPLFLAEVLGKEETLKRINYALEKIKTKK